MADLAAAVLAAKKVRISLLEADVTTRTVIYPVL
jgi:hypothetical protein